MTNSKTKYWAKTVARVLMAVLVMVSAACSDISTDSIVKVRFGEGGACTGFFVESDRVITSSHCFDEGDVGVTVTYIDENGEAQEIAGEMISCEDGDEGIAVVDVDLDGPVVSWCDANIGNRVKVWGWLDTEEAPHSAEGRVLFHAGDKYWSTVDTSSGYSGGPVVDKDGCVVAMHHGRTDADFAYAVVPDFGVDGGSSSSDIIHDAL